MKKIFFYIILLYSFLNPVFLDITEKEYNKRKYLFKNYYWLNNNLYNLYLKRNIEYKVSIKLAICVIESESRGKIIKSKKNKNGTRDYGRFQINSAHMSDNPEILLNDEINSKFGFYYLSKCLEKSNNFLPDAIRMYNQGLNGNRYKYNNWKYVEKIIKCYSENN